MENGKQGAFACVDSQKQHLQEGLTKREYFAGLAMQGMFSQDGFVLQDLEELSYVAVRCADALLKELENFKSE